MLHIGPEARQSIQVITALGKSGYAFGCVYLDVLPWQHIDGQDGAIDTAATLRNKVQAFARGHEAGALAHVVLGGGRRGRGRQVGRGGFQGQLLKIVKALPAKAQGRLGCPGCGLEGLAQQVGSQSLVLKHKITHQCGAIFLYIEIIVLGRQQQPQGQYAYHALQHITAGAVIVCQAVGSC